MSAVVELDRVSYRYPGAAAPALANLSLKIDPGELVVVVGASGSGKSTLLRVTNGLVPHFHGGEFWGSAEIAGMGTREHGPADLAMAVGTLLQDPETQVVMGTVRAELALPLENRGETATAVARGVEEAALALGIGQLLDRPTPELSGGELQRVALGAALVGRPALIVLDEPTSQLDPVAGDELLGMLRRLNEDTDAAVLMSEHRLERCLSFADRVIALVAGEIECDAAPEDFLRWAIVEAPELVTPGASLLGALGLEPAAGVKAARRALRNAGLLPAPPAVPSSERPRRRPGRRAGEPVLEFERVWHELRGGPAILRSLSLSVHAGERVALMGRNGAGKSTLLRHAAGLMTPTRGRVRSSGRVALLLQNPSDYLVAEHVRDEVSAEMLPRVGLDPALAPRHPRELSVGEKQRLALAIVLDPGGDAEPPAIVCLDEPTRGLDRGLKLGLSELLSGLPAAVLVATHDPEFVAAWADRVVLLGEGTTIADAPTAEVLSDGTYFATETARILGGFGRALTPAQGARVLFEASLPEPAR